MGGKAGGGARAGGGGVRTQAGTVVNAGSRGMSSQKVNQALRHLGAPRQRTPFGMSGSGMRVIRGNQRFTVTGYGDGSVEVRRMGTGRYETGQRIGRFGLDEVRDFLRTSDRFEYRA